MHGRMQGTNYISSNNLNGREFIFNVDRCLIGKTSNAMNVLHTQIASLNNRSLKSIAGGRVLRFPPSFKYLQCYHAVLQTLSSQNLINQARLKLKWNHQKKFNMLHLAKKVIEIINLPAIFNSSNVISSLVTNKYSSFVAYDLTALICSKIFNYINFASDLYVDCLLARPTIILCNFDKSPFLIKITVSC